MKRTLEDRARNERLMGRESLGNEGKRKRDKKWWSDASGATAEPRTQGVRQTESERSKTDLRVPRVHTDACFNVELT